jgi:uncharacterized protein YciI
MRRVAKILLVIEKSMIRYLVIVMRTPQFQVEAIEPHRDFLERLRHNGQLEMAGPFTDKTGGAYLIKAESFEAAQALAFTDPLYISQSSIVTIHEWDPK